MQVEVRLWSETVGVTASNRSLVDVNGEPDEVLHIDARTAGCIMRSLTPALSWSETEM